MKNQIWPVATAVAVGGAALNGCSSPMASNNIYDRLERAGIPRPAMADEQAYTSAHATQDVAVSLPSTGITLADLLNRAEMTNPELRSSRLAVGVSTGQVWQAGLYPNPTVSLRSGEIGFEGDSSNTVFGVTQPIVIGNRLRAAVAAADADEAVKLADVERVRREVFGQIAELHARVLELDAQLKLVDELISVATETLGIAETRFEARAVAEPDVIRPRVEVYQLRADRQRIAQELAAAEKQLGLLLRMDPIGADRLIAQIPLMPESLDEAELVAGVELTHPALIVADRHIDAADAAVDRIRAERVPDLKINAGIGYSDEGDQGIAEIGVGAEIPLWDRRQGDVMSARFDLMKRRQDKVATRNRILSQLAEELGAYNAARDQLTVLRDQVVPEAQRAFDQIDESYRSGRASFIELLDAQRTLMQSRRTLIELAGRACVARARIAAICGMDTLAAPYQHPIEHSRMDTQTAPEGAEEN
ncbi:MAG: TolC family protein [Phycisphaerales bacterium JB052]